MCAGRFGSDTMGGELSKSILKRSPPELGCSCDIGRVPIVENSTRGTRGWLLQAVVRANCSLADESISVGELRAGSGTVVLQRREACFEVSRTALRAGVWKGQVTPLEKDSK